MDMDPICEPLYGGIATALYAPDIAALIGEFPHLFFEGIIALLSFAHHDTVLLLGIVNFTTTSAASSVQTATTNLATAQTNLVLAQAVRICSLARYVDWY